MSVSTTRRTILAIAAGLAAPALRLTPAFAQSVRTRVGVIPIIGSSPIFVVDREGWAREAGLDLAFTTFESG
ncbi:MAG: NitT/TauT family transport system substrate-binding protein, partial [Xanthobacteraceae bacterium]